MTITEQEIRDEIVEWKASKDAPTHVGEFFLRFMCEDEFFALLMGQTVENSTEHALHANTNSQGACFLRLGDEWDWSRNPVEQAYDFLSGIVSNDVAVLFKNVDTRLKDGYGIYSNPLTEDWGGTMRVDEYSTRQYSFDTMQPLATYRKERWEWVPKGTKELDAYFDWCTWSEQEFARFYE